MSDLRLIQSDSGNQDAPAQPGRTKQIIVLGMHRSGTSATAGLLAGSGAFVGAEEELTRPNLENPRGFFERLDARAICDGLLRGAGAEWWKVSAFNIDRISPAVLKEQNKKIGNLVQHLDAHGTWALKEPRLCLLLPVLRRHLQKEAVCVFVTRHPLEVAQSLRRRNGFSRDAALALWEAYTVTALAHSAGMFRLMLSYADLVGSPGETVKKLVTELTLAGVGGLKEGDLAPIDPQLRHELAATSSSGALLSPSQVRLWEYLAKGEFPPPEELQVSAGARLILEDFETDRTAMLELDARRVERVKLDDVEKRLVAASQRSEQVAALRKSRNAEVEQRRIAEERAIVARSESAVEKARAERAEAHNHQLAVELQSAKNLLAEKLVELRAASSQAAEYRDRAERALALTADLQSQLRAAKDDASANGKELKPLNELLQSHRSRADNAEARIDELLSNLQTAKIDLAAQSAELAALKSQSQADSNRAELLLQTRDARAAEAEARFIQVLGELQAAKVDLASRSAEYAILKSRSEAELSRLDLAYSDALAEIRGLMTERKTTSSRRVARRTGPSLAKRLLALVSPRERKLQLATRHAMAAIRQSDLFDAAWYLHRNPDVDMKRIDPLYHYARFGGFEGRDPSHRFSSAGYLERNPDVRASGYNPLAHYVLHGRKEGRVDGRAESAPAAAIALPTPSSPPTPATTTPESAEAAAGVKSAPTPELASRISDSASPPSGEPNAAKEHIAGSPQAASTSATTVERERPPADLHREVRKANLTRLIRAIPSPYYNKFEEMLGAAHVNNFTAQIDALLAFDLRRLGSFGHVNGPLVSVVMPVLNRADLVTDAIGTVLTQTHGHIELLICDDGSTDGTIDAVGKIRDGRIKLLRHEERRGAAAARNTCLRKANGKYIAYLDSDNLWHPRYLECMIDMLERNEGRIAGRAPYFDISERPEGLLIRDTNQIWSSVEHQIEKPTTDLNSFVHRADALNALGGFDERLNRRQDYDLIARFTWLRDPVTFDLALNIYRRIPGIGQITSELLKTDVESPAIIQKKVEASYESGLDVKFPDWVRKVTVISWDMSRNHFAKAYSVAEALSQRLEVELISFRFFEEEIFAPLANKKPAFETKYFKGCDFPDFFDEMAAALNAMTGDVIYALKPRLPSLGLALMDNYHRGTPIMLECNDLETVVHSAQQSDRHKVKPLEALAAAADGARSPYGSIWSEILDPLVADIPVVFTHNQNLNRHYGNRCLYMRNIKNEAEYTTVGLDRDAIRAELGLEPDDKIILFGGLVRKHKGINQIVELLDRLDDPTVKLLVIGSRETPDLRSMRRNPQRDSIIFLPPQPPEEMAKINFASDLVLLWLDPKAAVSQFQMPYKLTDAIAMGPAIIGSPASDLPLLENAGALWTVPFGDFDALVAQVKEIFANPAEREARKVRARRIFEREFTYGAAAASFALGAHRLPGERQTYDVAHRFAKAMAAFKANVESVA